MKYFTMTANMMQEEMKTLFLCDFMTELFKLVIYHVCVCIFCIFFIIVGK